MLEAIPYLYFTSSKKPTPTLPNCPSAANNRNSSAPSLTRSGWPRSQFLPIRVPHISHLEYGVGDASRLNLTFVAGIRNPCPKGRDVGHPISARIAGCGPPVRTLEEFAGGWGFEVRQALVAGEGEEVKFSGLLIPCKISRHFGKIVALRMVDRLRKMRTGELIRPRPNNRDMGHPHLS